MLEIKQDKHFFLGGNLSYYYYFFLYFNYVIFRPRQKRLPHSIIINIFDNKTNAFVQLE